jgi:hypothetical protein
MHVRLCLGTFLLAMSFGLQAADQPVAKLPPAGACAYAPCAPSAAPILMVSIQPETAPVAIAEAAAVDEVPFVSLFERSPLMRLIAWYCGLMAPVALMILTGITIFEYRKRRKTTDGS